MWIERLMAGISHQHVLSYNPTKMKNFASDRARRENVPRHILSYCYRKRTGATGLVPTNKVEGQSSRNKWDKFYFVQWR